MPVDSHVVVTLANRAATKAFARKLSTLLSPGDLVLLEGELGAGKTFYAGSLIHALGVPSSTPVQSPTFTLVQIYQGRWPLVHCDLYRLSDEAEVRELGLQEQLAGGAVLVCEWGARFAEALGMDALLIELVYVDENRREARISARGARGELLLAGLKKALAKRARVD